MPTRVEIGEMPVPNHSLRAIVMFSSRVPGPRKLRHYTSCQISYAEDPPETTRGAPLANKA